GNRPGRGRSPLALQPRCAQRDIPVGLSRSPTALPSLPATRRSGVGSGRRLDPGPGAQGRLIAGSVMVTSAPATKLRIACKGWLLVAGWILGLLVHPRVAAEPAPQSSRPDDTTEAPVALTVEGISPVSEDDDPRVLYILPW